MNRASLRIIAPLAVLLFTGIAAKVAAFSEGYILCGAYGGTATYLYNKNGEIVHTWNHSSLEDSKNGYSCYLLENGNLLRSGQVPSSIKVSSSAAPRQGTLAEIDANGTIIWSYVHATLTEMTHHDFKPMPNGNILCVSFVTLAKDSAIARGFDPELFNGGGSIWGGAAKSAEVEKIFELKPDRTGSGNHQIVWEWNIMDHIVPITQDAASHPEKFSGYLGPLFAGQWMHLNGIDYNPVKDLIVFSSRVFSEIFIIDHSTTTAEAATSTGGTYGKGGDLLYRWGRPSNYLVEFEYDTTFKEADTTIRGNDTTIREADTIITRTQKKHAQDLIYCLHCPTWIPEGYPGAGNIMFFHNNVDDGMKQLGSSQAVEVTPVTDANGVFQLTPGVATGPASPAWVYDPGDVGTMFSASMSSALRMKNGNTLIHEAYPGGNGSGANSAVREVDPQGTIVWGPFSLEPEKSDTMQDTTTRGGGGMGGFMPAGFNPAKIMYYSDNYIGLRALCENVGGCGTAVHRNQAGAQIRQSRIRYRDNRIDFFNAAGSEITIYSLQGKVVARLHPMYATFSYSTGSLPSGTWLVRLVSAEGTVRNRRITISK